MNGPTDSDTIPPIAADSSTSAETATPKSRTKPPFALKDPRPDPQHCAAAECERISDVIDGTRRFWDDDVALCDHHYSLRPDPDPMDAPLSEESARLLKQGIENVKKGHVADLDWAEFPEPEDDEDTVPFTINPKSHKLF